MDNPGSYIPPTPIAYNPNSSSSTPSWLQDNAKTTSVKTSSSTSSSTTYSILPTFASPAQETSAPSNDANSATAAASEQSKLLLMSRLINLGLSILIIIISSLTLMTSSTMAIFILSLYMISFSCLLCSFELKLKAIQSLILKYFGFLRNMKTRGFFILFIGTILFSLSFFGKLVGIGMMVNGGFHLFIVFKYPELNFDEGTEIKDGAQNQHLEAANSQMSSYFSSSSQMFVNAGVDAIKSNPGNYLLNWYYFFIFF